MACRQHLHAADAGIDRPQSSLSPEAATRSMIRKVLS